MPSAHLFILSIDVQAGLEPAAAAVEAETAGKMVPTFLSVTWCGEAFQGLGAQDVESLILVDALSLFHG
jgi:hypothetical protein